MKFQSTNSSVMKLFLDEFQVFFLGVMNYRIFMKLIGSKSGKNSKLWANFGRCTGTCTGVHRYTPPEANMYRYMFNMYRYMPT